MPVKISACISPCKIALINSSQILKMWCQTQVKNILFFSSYMKTVFLREKEGIQKGAILKSPWKYTQGKFCLWNNLRYWEVLSLTHFPSVFMALWQITLVKTLKKSVIFSRAPKGNWEKFPFWLQQTLSRSHASSQTKNSWNYRILRFEKTSSVLIKGVLTVWNLRTLRRSGFSGPVRSHCTFPPHFNRVGK